MCGEQYLKRKRLSDEVWDVCFYYNIFLIISTYKNENFIDSIIKIVIYFPQLIHLIQLQL